MGITRMVRPRMVHPVRHRPIQCWAFHSQSPRKVRNGFGHRVQLETPVRQQSVITKGDANATGEPIQAHHPRQTLP